MIISFELASEAMHNNFKVHRLKSRKYTRSLKPIPIDNIKDKHENFTPDEKGIEAYTIKESNMPFVYRAKQSYGYYNFIHLIATGYEV